MHCNFSQNFCITRWQLTWWMLSKKFSQGLKQKFLNVMIPQIPSILVLVHRCSCCLRRRKRSKGIALYTKVWFTKVGSPKKVVSIYYFCRILIQYYKFLVSRPFSMRYDRFLCKWHLTKTFMKIRNLRNCQDPQIQNEL